jgi:hypothetical protein
MNVINTSDRDDAWGMTLAFWGVLLVSATIFAAVSLAPRFRTLSTLRARYAENQLRLVELERQAIELEKVAQALQGDPAFAAELAKLEFAAERTGDERIDVSEDLQLGAGLQRPRIAANVRVPNTRLVPLVELLAGNSFVRTLLLTFAGLLAAGAFLLLNDQQAARLRAIAASASAFRGGLFDRYRRA